MIRIGSIWPALLLLAACGSDESGGGLEVIGGRITQLTTSGGADPAWSPDGAEIAYVKSQNIWLTPSEVEDPIQVTSLPGREYNPQWNPASGGRQLVFCNSDSPDSSHIYTLELDGGEAVRIYSSSDILSYPSFTHDGSSVAFVTSDPKKGLMLVGSDGGEAVEVNNSDGWQLRLVNAQASPAGPQVCYVEQGLADHYIRSIPPEGGQPTSWLHVVQTNQDRDQIYSIAFNADGTKLAVVLIYEGRSGRRSIYYLPTPGGDLVQLTLYRQDGDFASPSWSPDGERLATAHTGEIWILEID
jgi:Tol biopolymer transport system component